MQVEINYQDGLMHRLESIYQDVDNATLGALVDRVLARLESATAFPGKASESRWDESSCMLITYADSVTDGRKSPLACLDEFIKTHLDYVVDSVHILPFFPPPAMMVSR